MTQNQTGLESLFFDKKYFYFVVKNFVKNKNSLIFATA